MHNNRLKQFIIVVEVVVLILVVILGFGSKLFGSKKSEDASAEQAVDKFIQLEEDEEAVEDAEQDAEAEDAPAEDTATQQDGINSWDDLSESVRAKLDSMSIDQLVAQVFITRPEELTGVETFSSADDTARQNLIQYPLGGILINSDNLTQSENSDEMLANMQAYSNEAVGLNLFIAVTDDTEIEGYTRISDFISNSSGLSIDTSMYDGNPESVVTDFTNGADVICIGTNFIDCYNALLTAVNEQRVPLEKLNLSVGRILTAKGM